jgi:hypothetical protein
VVKATAQIGNLTLLSVLGEAPHLPDAENQACQKLFQVLKLTSSEDSTPPITLGPKPTPPIAPLQEDPTAKPIPSEYLPESIVLNPIPVPLNPIPPHSNPQTHNLQNHNLQNQNHTQNHHTQNSNPKSEPYRMVQPLGREEIMAPEVDDWSEELAQIEAEVKRLGWTPQQESEYLQQYYGKLSRDHITDYGELLQFLTDLQGHPSPPHAQRGIDPWGADVSVSQRSSSPLPSDSGGRSRQDMMDQVLAEIHRIGWTARQGSEYLQQTYQVKTRQDLTNDQLQEFIIYLQNHP